MRKYEAIDLIKLHEKGSSNGWNQLLDKCVNNNDINGLAVLMYRVQAGMDDLVKSKLNIETYNIFFARLIKSLEETARLIIRKKHPLPPDNPKSPNTLEMIAAKRKRDDELARFFKEASY